MAFSGIFSIHVVCIFFIDVDDAPYALIPSHLLIECFIDRYLLIFILQTDKSVFGNFSFYRSHFIILEKI